MIKNNIAEIRSIRNEFLAIMFAIAVAFREIIDNIQNDSEIKFFQVKTRIEQTCCILLQDLRDLRIDLGNYLMAHALISRDWCKLIPIFRNDFFEQDFVQTQIFAENPNIRIDYEILADPISLDIEDTPFHFEAHLESDFHLVHVRNCQRITFTYEDPMGEEYEYEFWAVS